MVINAKITGITYTPLLCEPLNGYNDGDFETALNAESAFLLHINGNPIAMSKWVSPKRTRSYPYARVYNTLNHCGKKVTVIPFVKEEGADGDRDFLQWDTISLMSLLGVYVIIAYYSSAVKNMRYANKITEQKFDAPFIRNEIGKLLSYQSDALHWNIDQITHIAIPANLAKYHYEKMEMDNQVKMHPLSGIDKRIKAILQGKDEFMNLSRASAQAAQIREVHTIQPKENVTDGIKVPINISNYLGGMYHLTCDEAKIDGNTLHLIEAKHTRSGILPSADDIKDGLVKMILFSNLKQVLVNGIPLQPMPILKLTNGTTQYCESALSRALAMEAKTNQFTVMLPNGELLCPNTR